MSDPYTVRSSWTGGELLIDAGLVSDYDILSSSVNCSLLSKGGTV